MKNSMEDIQRKKIIDDQIQKVCNALGVELEREFLQSSSDFEVSIRLPQLPRPYGLSIHIGDDYLIWRIELSLDDFSRVLLEKMQKFFNERNEVFFGFYDLARKKNKKLDILINYKNIENSEIVDKWQDFNLIISNSYASEEEEYTTLYLTLLDLFCLILILLIEETEWNNEKTAPNLSGAYEGEKSTIEVNKYERSRYNRAVCLAYYGFRCRGCGLEMQEKYGPLGEGVIHVHHHLPVSQMEGRYRIDPIKDLVPLCPNCHNIVHKVNPPLPIDELKKISNR